MNKSGKKYLKIFLIGLALVAIFFSCLYYQFNKPITYPEDLPNVNFKALNDELYSIIPDSENLILVIFFNTACDHCVQQAEEISRSNLDFQSLRIFWVSNEEMKMIQAFSKTHQLIPSKHHIFLQDTEGYMFTEFKIRTTPTILLYSQNGSLKTSFEGFSPVNEILRFFD